MLNAVVNPLRLLGKLHGSFEFDEFPLLRAFRRQTFGIEGGNPLREEGLETGKGSIQKLLGGSIVLMEYNAPGVIIPLIASEHLLGPGTTPFVNGLKIIPAQEQPAHAKDA